MRKRFLIVILTVFILLSAVFFALSTYVPEYSFVVLETGNAIMAVLAFIAFQLVKNQMDGRTEAFVRGVSGSSFLKLMVCMVSILVYVLLNRAHIHKPTVFVLFGIYAVYTIIETWLLSKIVRE